MLTQYNADSTFRHVDVQNELLGFSDRERMEVYEAFKRGYVRGHLIIAAIKRDKLIGRTPNDIFGVA